MGAKTAIRYLYQIINMICQFENKLQIGILVKKGQFTFTGAIGTHKGLYIYPMDDLLGG